MARCGRSSQVLWNGKRDVFRRLGSLKLCGVPEGLFAKRLRPRAPMFRLMASGVEVQVNFDGERRAGNCSTVRGAVLLNSPAIARDTASETRGKQSFRGEIEQKLAGPLC